MQRITKAELTNTTDIGPEQLKSMRRRDQVAIALGGDDIAAGAMYLPLDAVAILVTAELARTYGATTAAIITRAFADVLTLIVAEAEDATADVLLVVADLSHPDGRRSYLASGADAMFELAAAHGYTIERATTVNISNIIRTVRANARNIGIDLSDRFVPTIDSMTLADIMKQMRSGIMGVITPTKDIKKRATLARKFGIEARAQLAMGNVAAAA